jgi:Na+-transporting methylmalonyl-CoA/oxaloacetate decarboxylase gamma subunit
VAEFVFEREEKYTVFLSDWWQQVSGNALQGLQITIVGMSLVFFTLGLIILALILLTRLPGLRAKEGPAEQNAGLSSQARAPQPTIEPTEAVSPVSSDAKLEQVAAIAVALLRSQRSVARQPRAAVRTSKWKQYGRAHQLGL